MELVLGLEWRESSVLVLAHERRDHVVQWGSQCVLPGELELQFEGCSWRMVGEPGFIVPDPE